MKYTRNLEAQKWVGWPAKRGTLEIDIDLEAIARQLATKAFFNKGRRSKAMAGAIIGKAHSVEGDA